MGIENVPSLLGEVVCAALLAGFRSASKDVDSVAAGALAGSEYSEGVEGVRVRGTGKGGGKGL